jgi:anaerobic selenocysteine-containing dehydrogenase
VALEQFQTETADHADIVLPVTTFLEHTDLYLAYGHYYLQLARPALPAPGETKSNVEIFRLLAERMGLDDPCFRDTEDDMIRTLLASEHPYVKGITIEQLDREHFVRLQISAPGTAFLPFAEGGFGTPSGKAELGKDNLEYSAPVESRLGSEELRSRFPLELISSKNDDSMNSTFGNRADTDGQTAVLAMCSEDAAKRKIVTGDQVRVFNDRGSCILTADVDGVVKAGVVRAPSVRWGKKSLNGQGINALTQEKLTDLGGSPSFYSCLVQVERCGD